MAWWQLLISTLREASRDERARPAPEDDLATDPDREGEAISWHLIELLKEKDALNDKPVHRVVFYEITKDAIREAIANAAGAGR